MAGTFDAGAVLARMELSHRELGKSITQIKKQFGGLEKDTKKNVSNMSKAWAMFSQAFAGIAVAAVAKRIADFAAGAVKDFATMSQAIDMLNNQLKAYGTSWDEMREKAREATAGTVSDLELIKQIGKGITLGLKPDELIEMMEIARAASRVLGEDMMDMVNSIVTGTARQSKLLLDNLGIIIDVEKAYADYAQEIGKAANNLSDMERKQAFVNAVLKEGKKITAGMGSDAITLAENIQRTATAFENFKIVIGDFLSQGGHLGYLLSFYNTQFEQMVGWLEIINRERKKIKTRELNELGDELSRLRQEQEKLLTEERVSIEETGGGGRLGSPLIPATWPGSYVRSVDKIRKDLADVENQRKAITDRVRDINTMIREANEDALNKPAAAEPITPTYKGKDKDKEKYTREKFEEDVLEYGTWEEKQAVMEERLQRELDLIDQSDLAKEEKMRARELAEREHEQALTEIWNEGLEKKKEIAGAEAAMREKSGADFMAGIKEQIEAKKEETKAWMESGKLATRLLVDDIATQSKILAAFEIAEGTKAMAEFLGTMNPQFLAESLQHALAAKQFLAAASEAGKGGGKHGGGGGGGGGGGFDYEWPSGREDEAGAGKGPRYNLSVVFHGNTLMDEDKLNQFVVNELGPAVTKAVSSGQMDSTKWTRE